MSLKNDWFRNMTNGAFRLHQVIHAMQLHFMTDYSYPKYNGRSKITMEGFLAKNRSLLSVYNRLNKHLSDKNISAEKYLFVGRLHGKYFINDLAANKMTSSYFDWQEKYSTKELYGLSVNNRFNDRFSGLDITEYSKVVEYFLDILSDIDFRNPSENIDEIHTAVYLLHKFPSLEQEQDTDAIITSQLNKLKKFYEFLDWWCLL